MARILVELTNRCNLRCAHCYDERHAASGDLSMAVVDRIVAEARDCGITHIVFTGGEPTVHRRFGAIVELVADAGYGFSLVSNGVNFPKKHQLFLRHRGAFKGVTFSLDGADPDTHDRLRGKGSFVRVMRAATLCVFKDLPFTINMVVTRQNRSQIHRMVELATRIGSQGVRFGHLISAPSNRMHGLDLSLPERRAVEEEIWKLQKTADLPIGMGPGYYSDSWFFPCAPLEIEEYNVDYRGNMTLCCQLSGITGANTREDVIADLNKIRLPTACDKFRERVERYLEVKRERVRRNELGELDHYPCLYCARYMGKDSGILGNARSWPTHPALRGINVIHE